MSTTTKACERCGRPIVVNLTRPQPVVRCCRDCRSSDPEYVRLRTSMACGARGFESASALDWGKQNGPGWCANTSDSGASPLRSAPPEGLT